MLHAIDTLLAPPARVFVSTERDTAWRAARAATPARDHWSTDEVEVRLAPSASPFRGLAVSATVVPDAALRRIRLRWSLRPAASARYLGDALERAYGDLEWRALVPERVMPWYVLVHEDGRSGAFGVATGAAALATWQIDSEGVSLDLDCRSGGVGVRPGDRSLALATIHARLAAAGVSTMEAARAFCRLLCPRPRLPAEPVYGGNNWYYAYAQTTQAACVEDAARIADWSDSPNRPWMIVDDGWQAPRTWNYTGGPWRRGNEHFPDMAALADGMRARGVRPGLWYRPLLTDGLQAERLFLRAPRPHGWVDHGRVLDPTVPEARELLRADMRRLVGWGFEMIKHDFSTYDLLGYWGSGLGGAWIADGWAFADRTRTSAEVVADLYSLLRDAAGDALLLGCDTVGHLAAGTHELQRVGDDTSGRAWERTRRMGVNCLAMRLPQHDAFFALDADCVGLTRQVAWEHNRQWLDLVSRSGTPLFVSAAPDAVGPEQERALRAAFARAAAPRAPSVPEDWLTNTCPSHWRHADGEASYTWIPAEGVPGPGEPIGA